jgi:acyl-coenzyme A thioesterase PaaI-like protein
VEFGARTLVRGMHWWPPFRGAGIRLRRLTDDFREAEVELRLGWFNRNAVGTHFGGSLFAMTDPFYMIMLMRNLGPAYLVWDKSASIEYLAPARGTVTARFSLTAERVGEIRAQTAGGDKALPEFGVDVVDAQGTVVARVHRTLYVRLKPRHRPA